MDERSADMDAQHAVLYPHDSGGIAAFFLGVVIFLIIAMDRPMRGEMSVPPTAYQLVYDVLMKWDEET
jgi:hypothetical protein